MSSTSEFMDESPQALSSVVSGTLSSYGASGSDPNHRGIWSPSMAGVCLLLQDLLQSCSRGGEEESGGHVL
jgi:hypothetical protein